MKARSLKGNSPGEINASLTVCRPDGYDPESHAVFFSVKQRRKDMGDLLAGQEIDRSGMNSVSPPAAAGL